MTVVGAVGRCRGVAPRAKTSMTIMRPPQHGQVGFAGIDSGSCRLAFRFYNGEQLTRTCDGISASAFGEQAVVADAVEAFWQHVDQESADELAG